MPSNIYEIIKQDNPKLAETLDTNHDVCDFLMALYTQLHYAAMESSKNPVDMRCNITVEKERLLIIRTSYVGDSGGRIDIGTKLPRQRNLNLVKFLQVNRNVRDVALNVVYALEAWLNELPVRKKQGFKNIKIENAMKWRSGEITAELVLKFEFDEMVAAKMNWQMDEPEQPTEEGSIIV